MELSMAVLAPFVLAVLAIPLHARFRYLSVTLFVGAPLLLFSYYLFLAPSILGREAYVVRWSWIAAMEMSLSLRLDGLSLFFSLLISGIGAVVSLYSVGYLDHSVKLGKFFSLLFFFMGSMLGLILAGDLILLFIFWEMTSVSSFLLIGFNFHNSRSRKSATQAFLVTGGAGLALMAGFILLGLAAGSFDISEILMRAATIRSSPLFTPCLLLILIGALAKSAQVPFHFWLPNAMAAPTPVSAYLHSATMVKAGVYLLARLFIVFGGTDIWFHALTIIGGLTAVTGPFLALEQTDLKRLLAYSTIGALGMMVVLLGLGSATAINAAIVFILIHSLYKGSLFMVAGTVDHQTGTRHVSGLSGLMRPMPLTALAAAFSAFSMAGFPPLFGYIGKELIYEAKLESIAENWLVFSAGVASNMMMVAIAFIVGLEPFLGREVKSPKEPKEGFVALWMGPAILAAGGLTFGIFPELVQPLLSGAADAVLGVGTPLILKPWHGFTLILFFSILTFFGGWLIFLSRAKMRNVLHPTDVLGKFGPEVIYQRGMDGAIVAASRLTAFVQNGALSRYVFVTVFFTVLLLAAAAVDSVEVPALLQNIWSAIGLSRLEEILCFGFVLIGAATAVFGRSRILALVGMGLVGFGLACFYAVFSAPDVAMTQILVETLSVTLTVFLITWLPETASHRTEKRVLNAICAAGMGSIMTVIAFLMGAGASRNAPVSKFFEKAAFDEANGRNIVNVILVDFRAIDTLGEISVVVAAAIGVASLMASRVLSGSRSVR